MTSSGSNCRCSASEAVRRVDTVIFQNLRVEVDADKFVQGILRHDEDTRVDGVLGLFHELFEEGFEAESCVFTFSRLATF